VVQDGIDVGDDTVIRGGIDSFLEVLLGTPFCALVSLLVKLSQIPNVVAIISRLSMMFDLHIVSSSLTSMSAGDDPRCQ
jgi:hypothetical protein